MLSSIWLRPPMFVSTTLRRACCEPPPTSITFVAEGKGSMAVDLGPYYTPGGEILAGTDHPLDLGEKVRRRNQAGEITEY